MIRLMYVQGINEVDTPFFESKSEQEEYFESHSVTTYDDETAYYPPYYTNRIKLPSVDIPFNDETKKVNYLSLEYEGKTFYYFIDSIDYVTDDLTELSISMDTIQTYMFDMLLTKPRIKRMPIKRWSNDKVTINRDYIRENLSEGNMRKISKQEMQYDDSLKWIVVRCSDFLPTTNVEYLKINAETSGQSIRYPFGEVAYRLNEKISKYEQTGGSTILIPYGAWANNKPIHIIYDAKHIYTIDDVSRRISMLASMNEVVSMSLLPYNPFSKECSFVEQGYNNEPTIYMSSHPVTLSDGSTIEWYYLDLLRYVGMSDDKYSCFVLEYPNATISDDDLFTLYVKTELLSTPITSNFVKGKPFNSKFVPAMIDESYYSIQVGCNGSTSIAPLFYNTKQYIYAYLGITLKGDRIYAFKNSADLLGDDFGNIITDMHNVMATDSNSIDFDLYTDPWKNYQVTHKGSMVTDWIATGANSVREGAWMSSFTSRGASNRGAVGNAEATPSNATSGYNTGFVLYRQSQYDFEAMRNTITSKRQTTMWGVY